jgi:predicted RNA-binding protein
LRVSRSRPGRRGAWFAQAGHGRKDLMSKPAKGDWIVYYAAKDNFDNGQPLQQFTAMGRVTDTKPYQPDNRSGFRPYRPDVHYTTLHPADIRPLIPALNFMKNKKRWGLYLISGFREISKEDFERIAAAMK